MSSSRRSSAARLASALVLVMVSAACAIDLLGRGEAVVSAEAGSDSSTPPPSTPRGSRDGASDAGADDADADLGDAPPDATSDAPGCPTSLPGPAMVPAGDAGFCIDSTEVTNAHYRVFYVARLADAGVDKSFCSWNTSYLPSTWEAGSPYYAPTESNVPVYGVDWCDAYAYCLWAGKKLCGALGGGPTPYGSFDDAGASKWTYACSRGGTRVYPYGDTYDESACFGWDHPSSQGYPTDAGALASCVGGFPGIYDMSGNAWEWEDGCLTTTLDAGASDLCLQRGGSAYWGQNELRCAYGRGVLRSDGTGNAGFRCCYP